MPRNTLGCTIPKREVPCSRKCGATLLRAVHFRDAICDDCKRKRNGRADVARLAIYRQQARRYRILCHILGWEPEQFSDLLEEAKASPMAFRRAPETRAARYDLALERRARASA